jgi:hypothetical protein
MAEAQRRLLAELMGSTTAGVKVRMRKVEAELGVRRGDSCGLDGTSASAAYVPTTLCVWQEACRGVGGVALFH